MPLDSAGTDADAPPPTATASETAWRIPGIARVICQSSADPCLTALARVDKSSFELAIPFLYRTMKLQDIENVISMVTCNDRFIRYVTAVRMLENVSLSNPTPCMIPNYAFRFPNLHCITDAKQRCGVNWRRSGTSFSDCQVVIEPLTPADVPHMLKVVTPLVPPSWSRQVICAPSRWGTGEYLGYEPLCGYHNMVTTSCWVDGTGNEHDAAMIAGRLKFWINGKGWPRWDLRLDANPCADLNTTSLFADILQQAVQRAATVKLFQAPLGQALSACIAHACEIRQLKTLTIVTAYPGREEVMKLGKIANRAWDDPCLPGPKNKRLAIIINLSLGVYTPKAIASFYASRGSNTAWLRDLAYILLQLGGSQAECILTLPTLRDPATLQKVEADVYWDIRTRWNAILQANINTIIEHTRANRPAGWRKIEKRGPRGGYRTRGGRTN